MRGFHIGVDEDLGHLRDYGISVSAKSSHAGGNPMSQRECSGFNWPGFSVPAGEPFGVSPESAKNTWSSSLLLWFSARSGFPVPCPISTDRGVAQLVRLAAPGRRSVPCDGPPFGPSCWQGVGQSAIFTCVRKRCWQVGRHSPSAQRSAHSSLPDLPASSRVGDSHEPQPLTDVRGADARSAQIRRPDGVIRTFHVRRNNVEPPCPIRTRNLLSKDDWRATLLDETEPVGPEVSFVGDALSFSGCAEGLTRATSGPNGNIICPTGEPKRVRPAADSGEEVALPIAVQIGWCDFSDISFINMSRRDVSVGYEVA